MRLEEAGLERMGEAKGETRVKGERLQLLKYWVEQRVVFPDQRGAFPGKVRTTDWPRGIFQLGEGAPGSRMGGKQPDPEGLDDCTASKTAAVGSDFR